MNEKTYSIIIEETITQEFKVIAESQEEALRIAEQKYKAQEFVLTPGNLISVEYYAASND